MLLGFVTHMPIKFARRVDVHVGSSCEDGRIVNLMVLNVYVYYFACWSGLKYCDEHVCVCVCVSVSVYVSVSVCLSVREYISRNTRDLYQFLHMLPMAVARFSAGGMTKSQGEGAILGGFIPY